MYLGFEKGAHWKRETREVSTATERKSYGMHVAQQHTHFFLPEDVQVSAKAHLPLNPQLM